MTFRDMSAWKVGQKLGGPLGGAVAAVVLAGSDEGMAFIGTKVGVYRTSRLRGAAPQWERLADAPLGVMALATSPNFVHDHTIIAGAETGIYISHDAGASWRAAQVPLSRSMVLALCCSPNFADDGIILAGTLEDGVWYSESRGERWYARNFGLLDATIFSLAISSNFARDETIYAGAETALYHSYNGARAWKQLPFPEDAPPILSLALSNDARLLYAGTEKAGLYRSIDQGESWERTSLSAASVSALFTIRDRVLAATESGVYQSKDEGETWRQRMDAPNAICMNANDRVAMAGLIDGAWMTTNACDDAPWHPLDVPSIRSVTGMALSPQFERDGAAFICGPREGIWRTQDGGVNWTCLNEALASLDIHTLAISPEFADHLTVVATSPDGVFLSADGGDHWRTLAQAHADVAAFSPNGELLAAAFQEEGIRVWDDRGEVWRRIAGPWDVAGRAGQVVALSIADDERFRIALFEDADDGLTVWSGTSGRFETVVQSPADGNSIVTFWVPEAGDRWYVAHDNQVWSLAGSSIVAVSSLPPKIDAPQERIVALTGIEHARGQTLFACTSKRLYRWSDAGSWEAICDFGEEIVIAFALSPAYPSDATAPQGSSACALLLGGTFIRLSIPNSLTRKELR